MTMTHSNIALLEKFNQLINNNSENLTFSIEKLFCKLKKTNQIRLIILCFLSCFSQQTHCQSAQLSPQQTRTQSVAYQTKAEWFLKLPQYNLDSSFIYFQRSINCLKNSEVSNYQALSEAFLNLYVRLNKINISPKVDVCLKKARYYFNKIPNKKELQLLAYNILIAEAEMSFSNGEKEQANKLMLEGFSLIQENKSPNIQARYLSDKGDFYNRLKSTSNGIKLSNSYLLKSKTLFESSNDAQKSEMLFKVYARLGWYQNNYGTPDSCDYYFEKQKFLLPVLKDPATMSYYSAMRANNYLRRKQYSEAAPLLLACQNTSEKYKLTRTEVYVFNTYLQGVRALDFKQYDTAISIFNKGLTAAKRINRIVFINDGYERLLDAYTAKGDFKTALKYKTIWANATLGEYDKNIDKSLRENELKLNIVKQNNEITQKTKEQNWYVAALIAGLIMLGLLLRNFLIKQKNNEILASLNQDLASKNSLLDKRNAENELLLKEIHHRVKNNLEVVSSLLALQSAKMDDPNMQEAMLASQNRVQSSMGILHQKLYQSEHLAFIEMKNYFENLCQNILDSYDETERIKVDINMKEINLDIDTAVPLGLIVNELFTNCLKYAFSMGKKGMIKLSLENLADGNLKLKLSDNGVGKTLNALPKGTGFGTQLVDLLTRQIDGQLIQEIHNGTMVSINFKGKMAA
jgi:two-component system, sensor histidine kinase PdtaS